MNRAVLIAYYAVGVPEPNGLLLAGVAGVVIGSRRRRSYAARTPLLSSSRPKASRFPMPRIATN
jgi:hypothetical protein